MCIKYICTAIIQIYKCCICVFTDRDNTNPMGFSHLHLLYLKVNSDSFPQKSMKNAASCNGKYTGKKKSKKVRNLRKIDYIFITKMKVNMQVMSFFRRHKTSFGDTVQ